mmetsp:Transcript_77619/g.251332  ORF Transcript_77619/g.251332 Transcript_77619/m.251332 type:complete len:233 (+) Transcript_77619:2129-2827(+)
MLNCSPSSSNWAGWKEVGCSLPFPRPILTSDSAHRPPPLFANDNSRSLVLRMAAPMAAKPARPKKFPAKSADSMTAHSPPNKAEMATHSAWSWRPKPQSASLSCRNKRQSLKPAANVEAVCPWSFTPDKSNIVNAGSAFKAPERPDKTSGDRILRRLFCAKLIEPRCLHTAGHSANNFVTCPKPESLNEFPLKSSTLRICPSSAHCTAVSTTAWISASLSALFLTSTMPTSL